MKQSLDWFSYDPYLGEIPGFRHYPPGGQNINNLMFEFFKIDLFENRPYQLKLLQSTSIHLKQNDKKEFLL